jgi:ribose/xylose/arabinose/galactoside ABC-type transport system permease subunit
MPPSSRTSPGAPKGEGPPVDRDGATASVVGAEGVEPVASRRGSLVDFVSRYTIEVVVAIFVVVLVLTNENFGTAGNIESVLRQAAFVGIGAAAMTLLMVSGAFDLSVASLLAICAIAAAKFVPEAGIFGAIVAALALGAALGAVNGLVVTRLRVPAFVATLGMLYVYLAIAFIWTNDQVVVVANPAFLQLGTGKVAGLPTPFVFMLASFAVCWFLFRRTRYGRHVRAIGSNERASTVAGIPVNRTLVLTFVLVGVFTALAGVLLAAQLSSANGTIATGYELSVIAVVVIGGTSLNGGYGTLLGTFTGALFFSVLSNALNLYGVGAYWQYVATGMVLITALGIEGLRRRFGLGR